MQKKKQLESANICTVASFDTSSRCVYKIAIVHTVGSTATVTKLGVIKKGGTSFTPNQTLRKMLETNGTKATEVNIMIGGCSA